MSAPYLLDTDTCIYLINRRTGHERLLAYFEKLGYGDVLISSISAAELEYGISKSTRGAANSNRFALFVARFEIAPFDQHAASAYGPLRTVLEAAGTPIGPLDTLIAAHALSLNATLITNNVREFSRVIKLKIENWFETKSA
jgi:tRNA(fMet)-specific endonuclease VapC